MKSFYFAFISILLVSSVLLLIPSPCTARELAPTGGDEIPTCAAGKRPSPSYHCKCPLYDPKCKGHVEENQSKKPQEVMLKKETVADAISFCKLGQKPTPIYKCQCAPYDLKCKGHVEENQSKKPQEVMLKKENVVDAIPYCKPGQKPTPSYGCKCPTYNPKCKSGFN